MPKITAKSILKSLRFHPSMIEKIEALQEQEGFMSFSAAVMYLIRTGYTKVSPAYTRATTPSVTPDPKEVEPTPEELCAQWDGKYSFDGRSHTCRYDQYDAMPGGRVSVVTLKNPCHMLQDDEQYRGTTKEYVEKLKAEDPKKIVRLG